MRMLHLTNSEGRNTTVPFQPRLPEPPPKLGIPGEEVTLIRYLAASDSGLHQVLVEKYGDDYAQALVDGDPEIDLEQVGRRIGETSMVYLSAKGEVLYAASKIVELIIGPYGEERERRIKELEDWRAEYQEALDKWRAGKRRVVFPYGTYGMRVFHSAKVAAACRWTPS